MVIKAVGITSEEVRLRGIFKLAGCLALVAAMAGMAEAQITSATLSPLTTFGSNGWLAPGAIPYLGTGNNERGLAFNPVTENVVLVSRANVSGTSNNIVILNGTSGSVTKTMNPAGISGGTFAINMAGVGSDGAIYVSNLVGNAATPGISKVYKWASESTTDAPTVAFQNTMANATLRFGDAFDVFGAGASTRFVSAGGGATGSNSVFAAGSLDGTNTFTIYPSIPNTTTASNDYRLSLAFVDANTIIGNQGGIPRYTSFGASATAQAMQVLTGTGAANYGAAQRALDYAVVGGTPVMAIIDSNSSLVQVFDVTNPAASILLGSGSTVGTPLSDNLGGTGQVAWGGVVDNLDGTFTARLYAMNTNQGVQAFTVTMVPEPSTWSMLFAGAALGIFTLRRKGSGGRREMTA